MINVVPPFSFVSTFNSPPCAFTISYANDNPSPVPWPVGLVVKKGWKILSMMFFGMPLPLSAIDTQTPRPPKGGVICVVFYSIVILSDSEEFLYRGLCLHKPLMLCYRGLEAVVAMLNLNTLSW